MLTLQQKERASRLKGHLRRFVDVIGALRPRDRGHRQEQVLDSGIKLAGVICTVSFALSLMNLNGSSPPLTSASEWSPTGLILSQERENSSLNKHGTIN